MKPKHTAGAKLHRWLTEKFDVSACEPLVAKLCTIEDDLADVARLLASAADADKPSLLRLRMRLLAEFTQVWKTCGLADPDDRRAPGRPPGT